MTMTEPKQTLDSQKTPQSLPSRASYGVPIVRIFEEIGRIITALYCIFLLYDNLSLTELMFWMNIMFTFYVCPHYWNGQGCCNLPSGLGHG